MLYNLNGLLFPFKFSLFYIFSIHSFNFYLKKYLGCYNQVFTLIQCYNLNLSFHEAQIHLIFLSLITEYNSKRILKHQLQNLFNVIKFVSKKEELNIPVKNPVEGFANCRKNCRRRLKLVDYKYLPIKEKNFPLHELLMILINAEKKFNVRVHKIL